MATNYPSFKKALQGLKGLSEKEAEAFFKLCNNKIFCVNDVKQVLVDIKAHKKSRSTAYNIVEKFEKSELITRVDSSNKKQEYECVHPRSIFNNLKIELEKAKKELPELETAYETSDFKSQDPREKSKLLKSENEIASMCYSIHKDYQLIIIHDKSRIMRDFLERISDCGKLIEGKINVILFKNKEKNESGIIEISKRQEKGSNIRLYGYVIFDGEKYNYFLKKEVKKNG